jgi:hypothetical protein
MESRSSLIPPWFVFMISDNFQLNFQVIENNFIQWKSVSLPYEFDSCCISWISEYFLDIIKFQVYSKRNSSNSKEFKYQSQTILELKHRSILLCSLYRSKLRTTSSSFINLLSVSRCVSSFFYVYISASSTTHFHCFPCVLSNIDQNIPINRIFRMQKM